MSKSNEETLEEAFLYYKPPPPVKHVIKLMYNEEGSILGVTFEDTLNNWIEISYEQWKNDFHLTTGLKVVNGKTVIIPKPTQTKKRLVKGERWWTLRSNRLICYKLRGNEKEWYAGWDIDDS